MRRRFFTLVLALFLYNCVTIVASHAVVLAPIAADDTYGGSEDNSIIIAATAGVLINDSSPGGTTLMAYQVDNPSHGLVTLFGNGAFSYTPAQNYFGVDTFTYRANDGTSFSNIATVTLNIASVNDLPVATDDVYYGIANTGIIHYSYMGLLVNDYDVDSPSELTVDRLTDPTHGALTIYTNGALRYVPAPNFSGLDSFTYRVFDGQDYSNPATVTFDIAPAVPEPSVMVLLIVAATTLLAAPRRA